VLLIGGASGSGKTSISYRLAHHFGIGITEADDIYCALTSMITAEQQPILHALNFDPRQNPLSAQELLERFLALCEHLAPAYEAVIANHLEGNVPLILEGDYFMPSLAAKADFGGFPNDGRVRGVFLHEEDEEQFVRNYLRREPESGRQEKRARISWLHSQWIAQQAGATGSIVLPARPWESGFERVLEKLSEE
jgi:2-phosphoglycerate kinase